MVSTFHKNRNFILLVVALVIQEGMIVNSFVSPLSTLSSQGSILYRGEFLTHRRTPFTVVGQSNRGLCILNAKGKRSKRRKEKSPSDTPSASSISEAKEDEAAADLSNAVSVESVVDSAPESENLPFDTAELYAEPSVDAPAEVESFEVTERTTKPTFKFQRSEALALGIEDAEDEDDVPPELRVAASPQKALEERAALDLPSMEELARRKKKQVEEEARGANKREKIDRRNTSKFRELLEIEPNADTDNSFFVPDEYGTVSALLGEGAQSFIGLPLSILQVGHFILALGIVLMAFVEYPGFPLTNLPSQLRGALQGGLGTVYLINIILSVFAIFEADKRGQPKGLWVAKTFTVGGLAFDQLTQLPTKEQQSRQGKRRNNK